MAGFGSGDLEFSSRPEFINVVTQATSAALDTLISVSLNGLSVAYIFANGGSGAKAYWMVTNSTAAPDDEADVRAGNGALSDCHGHHIYVVDQQTSAVVCDLRFDTHYKVWMVVDSDGAGRNLSYASPQYLNFTVPRWIINPV